MIEEVRRVAPNLLVLDRRQAHRLGALGIAALADEVGLGQRRHAFADVLDPLVHLAEERLVPRNTLFPRHGWILGNDHA